VITLPAVRDVRQPSVRAQEFDGLEIEIVGVAVGPRRVVDEQHAEDDGEQKEPDPQDASPPSEPVKDAIVERVADPDRRLPRTGTLTRRTAGRKRIATAEMLRLSRPVGRGT
jgi:hypothetical protein